MDGPTYAVIIPAEGLDVDLGDLEGGRIPMCGRSRFETLSSIWIVVDGVSYNAKPTERLLFDKDGTVSQVYEVQPLEVTAA